MARAETIGIDYNPSPLIIAKGDTSKHIVKVGLRTAPTESITLTLNYSSDIITPGKTTINVSPSTYKNIDLGITLTKKGAASSELTSGALAVSLFGQAADKKTSYTGTLLIKASADPTTTSGGTTTTYTKANSDSGPAGFGAPLATLLQDQKGFVYTSWRVTRGAINSLLIIALLAISFSNILKINIDTYTVKKALPNLVIGVILANVSFLIIRYLIDINTVATYFFVNLSEPFTGAKTFHGFLTAAAELVGANTIASTLNALGPIIVLILAIISTVVLLWLAFILYFRLVAIYLLTILAPLAFVAYGVPGFEKYFKQWWQQFVKWVFMLPAMSALFWLMIVIAHNSISNASIAGLMIMYLLLVTALSLPSKMGGAVIDKASKAFQKYTGVNAAKKFATEQAQNTGKAALARIPGVYRVQEWNKLRKENFEKDLAVRRKRAGVKARGGEAGLREATLAHQDAIMGNFEAERKAERSERALTSQLAERLNGSDIKKTTAEKLLEKTKTTERMKFLNSKDPVIQELLDTFAKESSRASAIADAVGTQESIITGNYTNKRLDALKALSITADATKAADDAAKAFTAAKNQYGTNAPETAKARQAYQDASNNLANASSMASKKFDQVKGDHDDLKDLNFGQALTIISSDNDIRGKIWQEEAKKQGKGYNGGIVAQTEDMRLNGSAGLLARELKLDDATIQKLVKGRAMEVSIKDQRDFHTFTETIKHWLKSDRNPQYLPGMVLALNKLVKQGKETLKYQTRDRSGNVIPKTIDSSITDLDKHIEQMGQEERKDVARAINEHRAFAGSASTRVNAIE